MVFRWHVCCPPIFWLVASVLVYVYVHPIPQLCGAGCVRSVRREIACAPMMRGSCQGGICVGADGALVVSQMSV